MKHNSSMAVANISARTGNNAADIRQAILDNLYFNQASLPAIATTNDWYMALALAVSQRFFNKNFLHTLLGQQLTLPQGVWSRLNLAWVLYSLFMAAINAYVAVFFSTEAWVNFKIWGYAFPIVFLIGQGLYVARHLPRSDESA